MSKETKHYIFFIMPHISLKMARQNITGLCRQTFHICSADIFSDPHPHAGVLSAGQYDLPQYLHIANFYMHFAIFYMH